MGGCVGRLLGLWLCWCTDDPLWLSVQRRKIATKRGKQHRGGLLTVHRVCRPGGKTHQVYSGCWAVTQGFAWRFTFLQHSYFRYTGVSGLDPRSHGPVFVLSWRLSKVRGRVRTMFAAAEISILIPLTPHDALLGIRGFQRSEFREFITAAACVNFIPSSFSYVRCTAHCHQQCVSANLANRPSHISCNRLFFAGS